MDKLTAEKRSEVMSRVKGKNTTPELRVRRALHAMGYRFRLYRKDLPGKPDIVLPKYRLCLFVHGCFWHQHEGCKRAIVPKSNREFWTNKLAQNQNRDKSAALAIRQRGWRFSVIWECETKEKNNLAAAIERSFAHQAF